MEISFTRFTSFAAIVLLILRVVVCLIRKTERKRFIESFEADIKEGVKFNEKTFKELQESGVKDYSEYLEKRRQEKK